MIWIIATLVVYLIVGLIYIREVRSTRRDRRLEIKFWVVGLVLGLPLLTLLFLQWAWLVITSTVRRVLNHRI